MSSVPKSVRFCVCGNHAWRPIGRGFVTLVSPQDAVSLGASNWFPNIHKDKKAVYVLRNPVKAEPQRILRLHRLVRPAALFIDHINGNALDNRQENLREADAFQNAQNRTRSGKRGATWKRGKWEVYVQQKLRRKYVGRFQTLDEATRAYANAVRAAHGEFANLRGVANG